MKLLVVCIALLGFLGTGQTEETVGEKTKVMTNSVGRAVTKGVNRTKEAVCGKLTGDSKVECLAKQGKHRLEEGADTVKDKAVEIKNKVDSDGK